MPLGGIADAMREFGKGELHSGKGGPVVKSRKQAIAIGLSAQRRSGRKRKVSSSEAADALDGYRRRG